MKTVKNDSTCETEKYDETLMNLLFLQVDPTERKLNLYISNHLIWFQPLFNKLVQCSLYSSFCKYNCFCVILFA